MTPIPVRYSINSPFQLPDSRLLTHYHPLNSPPKQVLDYTQYYLDLDQANLQEEAVWQPEYNLTTYYYGLAEVSSVALHNLADRFSNADDTQFAK